MSFKPPSNQSSRSKQGNISGSPALDKPSQALPITIQDADTREMRFKWKSNVCYSPIFGFQLSYEFSLSFVGVQAEAELCGTASLWTSTTEHDERHKDAAADRSIKMGSACLQKYPPSHTLPQHHQQQHQQQQQYSVGKRCTSKSLQVQFIF